MCPSAPSGSVPASLSLREIGQEELARPVEIGVEMGEFVRKGRSQIGWNRGREARAFESGCQRRNATWARLRNMAVRKPDSSSHQQSRNAGGSEPLPGGPARS